MEVASLSKGVFDAVVYGDRVYVVFIKDQLSVGQRMRVDLVLASFNSSLGIVCSRRIRLFIEKYTVSGVRIGILYDRLYILFQQPMYLCT